METGISAEIEEIVTDTLKAGAGHLGANNSVNPQGRVSRQNDVADLINSAFDHQQSSEYLLVYQLAQIIVNRIYM